MRTNYAGFALAAGTGLIVVLLGLLGLSAAGLTNLAPDLAVENQVAPLADSAASGAATPGYGPALVAYKPANPAEAADIAAGDALFKNNCTQCHAVREKVVGPALAGIDQRRPIGWIVQWVRNSSKVVASGDAYAVKLFEDNGKQQMPAFPQLTDQDIKAIVAYVTTQEGTVRSVQAGAVVAAR